MLRIIRKEVLSYLKRGLVVVDVHADQEFECVREELATLHLQDNFAALPGRIKLEVCTSNDHTKEVERSIRSVKETVRATVHGMPYRRLPKQLVHALVQHSQHGYTQQFSILRRSLKATQPQYYRYRSPNTEFH